MHLDVLLTDILYVQGCRAALESRIILLGSVAGGIGIVFGILEVGFCIDSSRHKMTFTLCNCKLHIHYIIQ